MLNSFFQGAIIAFPILGSPTFLDFEHARLGCSQRETRPVQDRKARTVGGKDVPRSRRRHPTRRGLPIPHADGWECVTWQQVGDRVRLLAAGLVSLGIAPEDRVVLASSTRYEWVLADLAVMCAGAATTTVYPKTNAGDAAYIVANYTLS